MDHQTASFWNGHKVTSHTEVCHSHWTTLCNLTLKYWNHTTTATKNIPKTNRTIGRLTTLVESCNNQLCHTFGSSHYVWWINGLIGRNHNHLRYLSGVNCLGNIVSSEDIIFKGFFWITFHHWHVLMGSSMVNNGWLVLLKYLKQAIVVLDVCNHRNIVNSLEATNQFMIDQINGVFPMTQENHALWIKATNLTANLRPNRTSCTCH